ncbi:hypothetical protein C5167_049862 [Papaver somniferum]|uniref:RNase H type-1 domain-containing protein n=1 Tax=Papaver somniferum TaxID=3469 RepID=A0A4Y7KPR6_PAPSO|nr:hypothetical protein C5167_049862 [Papaver somniferum]
MLDCNEFYAIAANMRCKSYYYMLIHKVISWIKPEPEEVAVNTDGSLCDEGARFGAIIRIELGTTQGVVTGSSAPVSITLHERQGIKMASNLGTKEASLETLSDPTLKHL